MKKLIKITLVFMLVLLTMLCTNVLATDATEESEGIDIVSTQVTAPEAGIYDVGQEVTITITFNKPIKGNIQNYKIYFGKSSTNAEIIELETDEITEFTTKVSYKYKLKSGDNGVLNLYGLVDAGETDIIEDESGNKYKVSLFGRATTEIFADTTIEWADFSNATVNVKLYEENIHTYSTLLFNNCTLKSGNYYYVHFSHDKDENITVKNRQEVSESFLSDDDRFWSTTISNNSSSKGEISLATEEKELFSEVGDVYITVCEIDSDTDIAKIVLKSKKIEKLSNLPLTQRFSGYFNLEGTSTFCWEAYSENQKNVNYKIGKVTDLELLKSLKNRDVTALDNLLKYAKDSEAMTTGTVKLGDDVSITDGLNLIDDEYYYVYLQLDTVNGKYVEVEDVSLYQALVSEDKTIKSLHSMTEKEFEWNFNENPNPEPKPEPKPEDSTTAEKPYDKAGKNGMLILMVITIVVVAAVVYRKNKKYEDIV